MRSNRMAASLCILLASWGSGCGMQEMINQGTARMAVAAAGQVAGLASTDDGCGFASLSTMLLHIANLQPGDDGALEMKWAIEGCAVGIKEPVEHVDCAGNAVSVKGSANVSGSQTVSLRPGIPLTPAGSHAVLVAVQDAQIFELEMEMTRSSAPDEAALVTVHNGSIAAEIEPVLGESASMPGTYSVPTPIARISNVKLRDADLTIVSQGNTIDVHVDDSDLSAASGPFDGDQVNAIEGYIVIDGERVEVDGDLEPDFDIEQFNERYACEEDLAHPV